MAANSQPSPARAAPQSRSRELESRRRQADTFLNFARLNRMLDRLIAELFDKEGLNGVTPAQANALMILFQARQPLTARQLADAMGLSQVTVGRFVKALHAAGWVTRKPDPTDARAMLLSPTRKATHALPSFIRVSNRLLDRAFAGFPEGAISRIAATTERLRQNLESPPEA